MAKEFPPIPPIETVGSTAAVFGHRAQMEDYARMEMKGQNWRALGDLNFAPQNSGQFLRLSAVHHIKRGKW
jgi:hypothetical protein